MVLDCQVKKGNIACFCHTERLLEKPQKGWICSLLHHPGGWNMGRFVDGSFLMMLLSEYKMCCPTGSCVVCMLDFQLVMLRGHKAWLEEIGHLGCV